jgi:PAS domain S-box-containing protein
MMNLIGNGIKFCRGADVLVKVTLEPQSEQTTTSGEGRMLRMDVTDSGPGLTATECERVFRPFERAAPEKGGGTGLGLYFSRAFARALGGDVTVASAPGVGSTFTLRVPVRVLPDAAAPPLSPREAPLSPAAATPHLLPLVPPEALMAAPAAPTRCTGTAYHVSDCEPPTPAGAPVHVPSPHAHGDSASEGSNGASAPPTPEESDAIINRMLEELLQYANDMFTCCRIVDGSAADFMPSRDGRAGAAGGACAAPIFTYVSASVQLVLGWTPAQLCGRNKLELAHADDAERVATMLAAVHDGSAPCAYILYRFLHADGSYRWLHAQICRQADDASAPEARNLLCIIRDATDFKNTEAALREYLLATSHDLRTPCHGIMTVAQLLAGRDSVAADAEASFLVQAVRSGCGLMLGIITNILEMRFMSSERDSALGAPPVAAPPGGGTAHDSRLNLKPVVVAPRELVAAVLQTCRLGCGLLRGQLEWRNEREAAQALPAAVYLDGDRATQILQNVIVYVLHHSPGDAPVTLNVRVERMGAGTDAAAGADADAGVLCVDVCDPGRRLWTEECERIFSPNFATSATPAGAGTSCSGLGLFVARSLARAMRGDVTAEVEGPCGGTELRVRLPVVCAPAPTGGGAPGALDAASPSVAHLAAASAAFADSSPRPHKRGADAASTDAQAQAQRPRAAEAQSTTVTTTQLGAPAPRPRCLLVDDHEVRSFSHHLVIDDSLSLHAD